MKFAIGPKTIFEQAGFETSAWRHSIDNEKVICHAEFAGTLLDLTQNPDILLYDRNSEAFQEILNTAFTNPNEKVLTEDDEPVFEEPVVETETPAEEPVDEPIEDPVTDTEEPPAV